MKTKHWKIKPKRTAFGLMWVVYTPAGDRVIGYQFNSPAEAGDHARRLIRYQKISARHLGHDLPAYVA